MDKGREPTQRIGRLGFISRLQERFPDIAAAIDDCCAGLLHLEMATLARATSAAIEGGDQKTVLEHFSFVNELFSSADSDLENAIYVSYLENLPFAFYAQGNCRELLPSQLKKAMEDLEAHFEMLSAVAKNRRES